MDYTILREATAEAERQVRTEAVGTHADEIETSMMLYMAPHIVRRELAVRDVHEDRGGANKLSPDPQGQGVYSPTGAWGDPTRATAEKGRVVVEALVSHIVGQIRRLESDDFVPAAGVFVRTACRQSELLRLPAPGLTLPGWRIGSTLPADRQTPRPSRTWCT
jgi:hypothetical protein